MVAWKDWFFSSEIVFLNKIYIGEETNYDKLNKENTTLADRLMQIGVIQTIWNDDIPYVDYKELKLSKRGLEILNFFIEFKKFIDITVAMNYSKELIFSFLALQDLNKFKVNIEILNKFHNYNSNFENIDEKALSKFSDFVCSPDFEKIAKNENLKNIDYLEYQEKVIKELRQLLNSGNISVNTKDKIISKMKKINIIHDKN